jgi:hypothetical protein
MSRVRSLAIVLLALSVVLSAVYATGAFSSLTAQRNADIQVTGDASSYLALQPAAGSNGAYASLKNGQLHVTLTGAADVTGQGVNQNAVTTVRDVFTVTNHGSQAVAIWLTDDVEHVTFRVDGHSIEKRAQAKTLQPGDTVSVGLIVDTRQSGDAIQIESMTIHADSEGASAASTSTSQQRPASTSNERGALLKGTLSVANSLLPFDTASVSNDDDTYRPPTVPVEKTKISSAAKTNFQESLPFAYRSRTEQIVYSILQSPDVAERYGEYRLIVGTPTNVDGWVALWVRGDTVVKIERGGQDAGRLDPLLQDPIQLTTPDGRTITLDPASESLTVRQPTVKPIEIEIDSTTVDDLKATVPLLLGTTASSPIIGDLAIAVVIVGTIYAIDAIVNHFASPPNHATSENEQTKHREQEQNEVNENEKNREQQANGETQPNRQTEDDGKSDRRRKSKTPRLRPPPSDLVPDGGVDKQHEAMNELRRAGIPSETIIKWSNKGYDIEAMSESFNQYQASGETLGSLPRSTAKGDLGEILAKPKIKRMYPRSQGYEYVQGVELKRNRHPPDITEIDWVVVDTNTGNVVAVYQVKSDDTKKKVKEAEDQLKTSKEEFENNDVDHLAKAPSLDTDDFTDNLDEIERYTVGPKKNSAPYYDIPFDLTGDELEALLDAIRDNGL